MIEINEIGLIKNEYKTLECCPANGWASDVESQLVICENLIDAMTNLKRGELIHVLWWFSEAPRDILKNYVNEDDFETGVFAMRSPHRPNPIALSLCEVKDISNNIITVRVIEALDGSPILDIKKAIIRDGVIL